MEGKREIGSRYLLVCGEGLTSSCVLTGLDALAIPVVFGHLLIPCFLHFGGCITPSPMICFVLLRMEVVPGPR